MKVHVRVNTVRGSYANTELHNKLTKNINSPVDLPPGVCAGVPGHPQSALLHVGDHSAASGAMQHQCWGTHGATVK